MTGEQRAARDGKVGLAGFAAEAQRAGMATAFVGIKTATLRAHRGAVRRGPTHLAKHRLRFRIRHTEHMGQREGLGFA